MKNEQSRKHIILGLIKAIAKNNVETIKNSDTSENTLKILFKK